MRKTNKLLALIASLAMVSAAVAGVPESVVLAGGCSGVVIEPGDIVLTAGHCDHAGRVSIQFRSGETKIGTVVSRPPGEGSVVIRLDSPVPDFCKVSDVDPIEGDFVTSYGYPGGNFQSGGGTVLRTQVQANYKGIEFEPVETSIQTGPGWSGGPLLNSRDEVVGLLSSGDNRSTLWVSLPEIRRSLRTLQQSGETTSQKQKLRVWVSALCPPCILYKADLATSASFRQTLNSKFEIETYNVEKFPEQAKRDGVMGVPTFIVKGGPRVVGYAGKQNLIKSLTAPEEAPPEVSDSVDWSLVRIVVLVAETDQSAIKGAVLKLAESYATGPIERKISEITNGKAKVDFVFERSDPARYYETTRVAGVDPSPFYILGMIKRQEIGFIKGLIVKRKLLPLIEGKLEGTPIEPIAERLHPGTYAGIVTALDTMPIEWKPEAVKDPPGLEGDKKSEDSKLDKIIGLIGTVKDLRSAPPPDQDEDSPSGVLSLGGVAALLARRTLVSFIGSKLGIGETS